MEKIVIIGGGPAGVSAALYAARAGKTPVIIENGPGGLLKAEKIENYYGNAEGLTGAELYEKGLLQARNLGVRIVQGEVTGVDGFGPYTVYTDQGDFETQAVILATGARRAAPSIPGLKALEGKGVSYCAVCDAFFYRKKAVAVLGNGDFALKEAEEISNVASEVTILTNGLAPAFSKEHGFRVDQRKIRELSGENALSSVIFEEGEPLEVQGLFVAVGTAGSSEIARRMGAELTEKRHVKVDEHMQTSIPGIFAAGDCTGGLLQVAKAVYEGAVAGMEAAKYVGRR